jgi:tetratricopeptide (TPR) repeat protein
VSGTSRAARAASTAALVAVTVLVHAPWRADFAYDDNDFVVANQSIRSLAGALDALLLPFPPDQPERGLYRPLTNLSYALDYALWDGGAEGFHATNVVLYAGVVVLVERLAFVYLGSTGFAAAVALLFAMHPVHCDAVDSVAGRSEILALLFGLASLLALLRALRGPARRRWLLTSTLAYALSCASKETGVLLPAVLAVHIWALHPPRRGAGVGGWLGALRPLAGHGLVLVAYLALRGAALGRFAPAGAILRESGLGARFATIGTVYLADLKLLLWPNLEVDFFYQAAIGLPGRIGTAALLGWVAIAASLAGALWLARDHLARRDDAPGSAAFRERAAALGAVAIFAATLLPTSHVLDIGALLAERFLFAPSLGFVLLAGLGGRRLLAAGPPALRARPLAWLLVGALAGVGAWRSHGRAAEWRDPARLWREAARSLPRDVRVHTNLAAVLIERGELGPARQALAAALALDPHYRAALGNLATLEVEEGRLDEAAATYERMLEDDPDDFLTWYNLGRIELQRGHAERAARHFRHALELNPNFSLAQLGLEAVRSAAPSAQGPR